MDFKGWIIFIILFLLTFTLAAFSQTTYEYDRYGKKTGYYVTNGNVTIYYDKYGSKMYEYKNNTKYDKYGKVVTKYH